MNAHTRLSDPTVRRSIEDEIERLISLLDFVEPDPDLEPWLAGGIEVVGADDREGDDERERDDCDLEEQHDAEAYCAEDYGDIAWSNDTDMPQEGSDWHRNGW
ncbi:hypothetical protein EN904_23270 [Mesorhizobium sp. M7A.F.Ca.CA.001.07.2.1]|uniref:hypothetical protein n=3 Tax=Phyllobacteriaceae TaxID=69277 RepID=UPI000FCC2A18|nr:MULTISPECIES: hypothetical protein [unclassified Mesorhizobium]RVB20348.1 hypothetical protein EN918_31425 [Mesorhizobium sp. M7A.F.Ca.CA.004.05.1.1]MCQ8816626.1 hypothetical protein [Mesorhizobium sp. SEMIA396]RUX69520.1 hypothetical protein EN983_27255 [Mesorhizobium sp. M7A.F.Ca.CA.004.08.2.1]RUX82707.1 hypothetical protein EN982_29995 [Mesorhizobium sp. M7A.F.Ca.CA.004.08.1.1]RUY00648.1 hypothetical protein EN985_24615 [Mesorhizobium sp. M7A.F.Ca.CA.004.04.1.1]